MKYTERREYRGDPDALPRHGDDPMAKVADWIGFARATGQPEFNAMALSTGTSIGIDSRMVLVKEIDAAGLRFFTSASSQKALQMQFDKRVAGLFFWPGVDRQLRVSGLVARLGAAATLAWWAQRPAEARAELVVAAGLSDHATAVDILRAVPAAWAGLWSGWVLVPHRLTFWVGRPDRKHLEVTYWRERGEWRRE